MTVTDLLAMFFSCWLENKIKKYHILLEVNLFAFLQTLQKHYHPDVAKAAMLINTPLSEQEDDINELLEITAYEVIWHCETVMVSSSVSYKLLFIVYY